MAERITSYSDFWPYYLREHARPVTRRIHYVGTGLVLIGVILAVIVDWRIAFLVPVAGYAPAWAAHFFVEKNRPATFRYPLWSLVSDFRMFFSWLAGTMPGELRKAGISN